MDTASSLPVSPTPIRRRKRIRYADQPPPKPTAPPALQKQVLKRAAVLERHRRVLGELGMQALQTATLQVVAQQLADIQALLRANGVISMSILGVPAGAPAGVTPHAPAGPKCTLCGRPGVYQMKTAQGKVGPMFNWYCEGEHANWARQEDGAARITQKLVPSLTPTNQQVSAVPAGGSGNLTSAMAALLGNEG